MIEKVEVNKLLPLIRSASRVGYPASMDAVDKLQKDLEILIHLIGYDRIKDIRGLYENNIKR